MERAIIFGQIGPGEELRKGPLALQLRPSVLRWTTEIVA